MAQELEIEFKNMLTKEEYFRLITHFKLKDEQFHLQHNHYFETANQDLRAVRSGLRIRQLDGRNELTLKEPAKGIALTETTDELTDEQVQQVLQHDAPIPAVEVLARLQDLNISVEDLKKIGTLSTTRAEIKYRNGLLVFDYSQYANQEDYELEYEVQDEESGRIIFMELLDELAIPTRPADKKLARFMKAIQQ